MSLTNKVIILTEIAKKQTGKSHIVHYITTDIYFIDSSLKSLQNFWWIVNLLVFDKSFSECKIQ